MRASTLPPLLLCLLTGCAGLSAEQVVRDFFAAVNQHDVDRALALLDEEYVFRDEQGTFSIPREGLRPLLEWDRAARARVRATIVESDGDTLLVRLRESNEFLDLLGVGPWRHEAKLVVRDGSLVATVVEPPAALNARVDRALEPVLRWARDTRPERLEGLVTGSGLVYDGDTARRWIALLRDAREAGVLASDRVPEP